MIYDEIGELSWTDHMSQKNGRRRGEVGHKDMRAYAKSELIITSMSREHCTFENILLSNHPCFLLISWRGGGTKKTALEKITQLSKRYSCVVSGKEHVFQGRLQDSSFYNFFIDSWIV